MLKLQNLSVKVDNKIVLQDVSFEFEKGKIYLLLGPNGSGKSSLARSIASDPNYEITSGKILFRPEQSEEVIDSQNPDAAQNQITDLSNLIQNKLQKQPVEQNSQSVFDFSEFEPHERAWLGFFTSFQNPPEVSGVAIVEFLKQSLQAHKDFWLDQKSLNYNQFLKKLKDSLALLNLDEKFYTRNLNQGFSGGERKKNELLQMLMLEPNFVVLDEIDSGLDIDAVKLVGKVIKEFFNQNKTIVLISHQEKLLEFLQPDQVLVMQKARIFKVGGKEILQELQEKGYDQL